MFNSSSSGLRLRGVVRKTNPTKNQQKAATALRACGEICGRANRAPRTAVLRWEHLGLRILIERGTKSSSDRPWLIIGLRLHLQLTFCPHFQNCAVRREIAIFLWRRRRHLHPNPEGKGSRAPIVHSSSRRHLLRSFCTPS